MTSGTIKPTRLAYAQELSNMLQRLRSADFEVRVPPLQDLFSKQPNAPFHEYPEVFIQTGGATKFNCPGSSFHLETGEVCVMPRGLPHQEIPIDRDTPYGICVVGISFGKLYLIRGHNPRAKQIDGYGFELLENSAGGHLARYLDDISASSQLPEPRRSALIKSLLEVFWIHALNELENNQGPINDRQPRLIMQAEHYARIHLSDPSLSVQNIAKALNCTPDHISRQFKRSKSITLTRWIATERIAQAKQLLESKQENISEIGWRCGFASSTYFIRTFKQHTQLTPKQYRESLDRAANKVNSASRAL